MTGKSIPSAPVIENGPTRVVAGKHGLFICNANDRMIGKSLLAYGEWCEGEIDTLLQVVEAGDIVIDVGANIGTHTIPLAHKVGQKGGVLALEPQRLVFQALAGNVSLNSLVNVVCINAAAGRERGRTLVPLYNPEESFNWAGVKAEGHAEGEETEVMALDDLGFNRCKLLKVDVAGMEAAVLEGAKGLIERCQPALFVSAPAVQGESAVLRLLADMGYDAWWHITRLFHPDNFRGNQEDVFEDVNPDASLICFPKAAGVAVDGFEPASGPDDTWVKAIDRIGARATGTAA